MAVAVPYVAGMLRPDTFDAVAHGGHPATFYAFDRTDDGAYARLVERLWGRRETFVVVEQDVVPHAGAIAELVQCPAPWCSHCYDDPGYQRVPMLGLAKFAASLLAKTPEVATTVLRDGARHAVPVHWRQLNEVLVAHLLARGVTWHRHLPDVEHHHREPCAAK